MQAMTEAVRARLRLPYYGWIIMAVLGVTTIISYGTSQYLFGVLVVPLEHDQGWSRTSTSGAYALSALLTGLLGVPVGRLVDRHGPRVPMAAGSLLAGVTLLLLGGVQQLWQFYLLWGGGIGLAMALTLYPVSFTVAANWFAQRRPAALAVLTLLGGLSSPLFLPLSGTLVGALGWRSALAWLAAIELLVAFPLHALVLRRHPEDLGLHPDGAAQAPTAGGDLDRPAHLRGWTLRQALGQRAFWTLLASQALFSYTWTALVAHQVAFLTGRGHEPLVAAAVAGSLGLTSVAGRASYTVFGRRVRPQVALTWSTLATAAGIVALLNEQAWGLLAAYVVLYGASAGITTPLRASVLADHVGRRAYGAISAVIGLPGSAFGAAGPFVTGWLYDATGDYTLPLLLAVGALVVSAACIAATPRPPE